MQSATSHSTKASNVVTLATWRTKKVTELAAFPALACPRCGVECPPLRLDSEGATAYKCVAHRGLSWRIDVDGNLLHGHKGRRFYQL